MAETEGELPGLPPLKPQLGTSPGVAERAAVARRRRRVRELLPTLPAAAQRAILTAEDLPTGPIR